ncbi:hypothetical protein AA313_de0202963 [Arthrobotrys entomopaga]|nr:hypothetical protein AA313_de0202963 [Arthrobotrys entomopaga]
MYTSIFKFRALKSPIIKIIISTEESETELCQSAVYYAHQDVLTKSSPYFARVLGSGPSQPPTREIFLDSPADTPKALEAFLQFAYTGDLDYTNYSSGADKLLDYANTYIFASKLQVGKLKLHALKLAEDHLERSLSLNNFRSYVGRRDETPEMQFHTRTKFVKIWWQVVDRIYAALIDTTTNYDREPRIALTKVPFNVLQAKFFNLNRQFKVPNIEPFKYLLVRISCTNMAMTKYDRPEFERTMARRSEYKDDMGDYQDLQYLRWEFKVKYGCDV